MIRAGFFTVDPHEGARAAEESSRRSPRRGDQAAEVFALRLPHRTSSAVRSPGREPAAPNRCIAATASRCGRLRPHGGSRTGSQAGLDPRNEKSASCRPASRGCREDPFQSGTTDETITPSTADGSSPSPANNERQERASSSAVSPFRVRYASRNQPIPSNSPTPSVYSPCPPPVASSLPDDRDGIARVHEHDAVRGRNTQRPRDVETAGEPLSARREPYAPSVRIRSVARIARPSGQGVRSNPREAAASASRSVAATASRSTRTPPRASEGRCRP